MAIKQMGLAWIVVSDLPKAIKFFTETVGLKLNQYHEDFGWAELSGTDGKGAMLGLAQSSAEESHQPGQNAVITMSVDNMVKSKEELTRKGVKWIGDVLEVPGHVKLQLFKDLDGNSFQLVESLDKL